MDIKYSIIISTLNRAVYLIKCLECLLKVDFDPNIIEVIVIDNDSTDDTKCVVDYFKDKISYLRYFFSDMPGLHTGRNLGFQKAEGDILCYIDDDSFVSKRWLKGIESAFSDSDVMMVGGPCLPEFENEPPRWLDYFWSECEFGKTLGNLSLLDFGEKLMNISPMYVNGCNFNIRKNMLAEVGGFHPDAMPRKLIRYRGDGESFVSRMLIEMGYKALYSPDVKIHHFIPASRMTTEYFQYRSYVQGISTSYAKIRMDNGVDNIELSTNTKNKSFLMGIIKIIKGKVKTLVKALNTEETEEIVKLREMFQKSSKEGFHYHQEEIKRDPKLLEWVLRENYLGENGKLPE